jgi:hypothetical protein
MLSNEKLHSLALYQTSLGCGRNAMQACCLEGTGVAGAWRECDVNKQTNKQTKKNYRDGCTYLRCEKVNIINKSCSLKMPLR